MMILLMAKTKIQHSFHIPDVPGTVELHHINDSIPDSANGMTDSGCRTRLEANAAMEIRFSLRGHALERMKNGKQRGCAACKKCAISAESMMSA